VTLGQDSGVASSTTSPPPAPPKRDCVGTWASWGACSAPCGGGKQTRGYRVTVPASGGGTGCIAVHGAVQTQMCNGHACPANSQANKPSPPQPPPQPSPKCHNSDRVVNIDELNTCLQRLGAKTHSVKYIAQPTSAADMKTFTT
jgi:hypothetical protein